MVYPNICLALVMIIIILKTPDKTQYQLQQPLHPLNLNDKHSFSVSNAAISTASTPTELKEFISQLSFNSQKQTSQAEISTADVNLLNTNSNSNFTSSGMGSNIFADS
ncbi:hypothetical protein EVAR_66611_1 [Eumeta japonica]|uniref:Uncharacterized protein n=1 Tax=Eumeta variegata TaxID=151549 RepID=A0A4C2A9S5_EUMVA|nr:hypothetical protein EVAR_66611_1 [Eumeta japonica]